jgi:hypothetical protein
MHFTSARHLSSQRAADVSFCYGIISLKYHSSAKHIPYEDLDLEQPSERFDVVHELTTKGLEKFAADYRKTIA